MADTPDTPADAKPAPRKRAPRKAQTPKPEAAQHEAAPPVDDKPAPKRRGPRKAEHAPAKPRAAKRTTPPRASRKAEPRTTLEKATDTVRANWTAAAFAGGLAAAGAVATAALLSLRGSTPKPQPIQTPETPADTGTGASATDAIGDPAAD
jgi:hypothetical protein